jgi:hypothetical protein
MNAEETLEFGIVDKIIKSSWFKNNCMLEYVTKKEMYYVNKRCL